MIWDTEIYYTPTPQYCVVGYRGNLQEVRDLLKGNFGSLSC